MREVGWPPKNVSESSVPLVILRVPRLPVKWFPLNWVPTAERIGDRAPPNVWNTLLPTEVPKLKHPWAVFWKWNFRPSAWAADGIIKAGKASANAR